MHLLRVCQIKSLDPYSYKGVTSERKVGKPKWENIQAAGPLTDKLAKLPNHLSLFVNIEVLVQEYGTYELYEILEVEYTYDVTHNGTHDYDSNPIYIGPKVPTGETIWVYTGKSRDHSIIDIKGCIVSCQGYDVGIFGNSVK